MVNNLIVMTVTLLVLQNWVPRLLVYGDMGKHGGAESLGALVSEVEAGDTHAILHVGDFAYDFDSDGGVVRLVYSNLTAEYRTL